jgi:hypothetical protein
MSIEAEDNVSDALDRELLKNILVELKKLVTIFSEVHEIDILNEDIDDGSY